MSSGKIFIFLLKDHKTPIPVGKTIKQHDDCINGERGIDGYGGH